MEFVTKVVECVNTFLWDYALLILLLGAGIIYSFSLKFIQIRKFGAGMKALFGNFSLHGGKGIGWCAYTISGSLYRTCGDCRNR